MSRRALLHNGKRKPETERKAFLPIWLNRPLAGGCKMHPRREARSLRGPCPAARPPPSGERRAGGARRGAVRGEDNEALAGRGPVLPPLEVSLVTAFPLPRSLIILLKGTILPFRLECLALSGVLERDIMPP